MTDRVAATGWLRNLATNQFDEVLAKADFTRRGTSTTYTRKVADGKQSIYLDLLVHPNYAKDSYHLSLRGVLAYAALASVRADMLADNPTAIGKGNVVHVAMLDNIVSNPEMLLFKDERHVQLLASRIRDHLIDDVLPYLDERNSIEKLIAWMWQILSQHPSPGAAGNWPVTVAAGQLATGHDDLARQTLEQCYPEGTAERIRYRRAFAVAGAG